jgi:hypothetical protein
LKFKEINFCVCYDQIAENDSQRETLQSIKEQNITVAEILIRMTTNLLVKIKENKQ